MLLKQGIQYFNIIRNAYLLLWIQQFFSTIWHALSSGRHKMFTASCDQLDRRRKISGEAQNTLFGWKGAFVNTRKSNNSKCDKRMIHLKVVPNIDRKQFLLTICWWFCQKLFHWSETKVVFLLFYSITRFLFFKLLILSIEVNPETKFSCFLFDQTQNWN